jgi:hypothetical protein
MEPPQVRAVFLANEHGSADGMWTLEAVASALAPMSANDPPTAGFACGGTLGLAAETIGFGPLAAPSRQSSMPVTTRRLEACRPPA